jgi:methionyl-tRNA synthetase
LCISRPLARLNWGIPLPFDPNYVTYVWFDALVNYASIPAAHADPTLIQALGPQPSSSGSPLSLWPADIHVIGKDILKFHSVYWPIMLKAMGLPLPKKMLVHGWWQKDGEKMSKTTGNVVDPIAVIDEWGVDAFRYYVLRELDIGPDGNWTDAGFKSRYDELANSLGNLVNRSLSMLKRYRNGVTPARSNELSGEAEKVIAETRSLLEQNQLQGALLSIWSLVTRANQYVEQTAPFKLAKDPAQSTRLDEVLYNLTEVSRILAILLWPFLPGTATKIYAQLDLPGSPSKFSDATWGGLNASHAIGIPSPLFPKKES